MKEFFHSYFQTMDFQVSEQKLETLSSFFSEQSLQKGQKFIEFDDTSRKIAFIKTGLVRFFLNTFEGQEFNVTFKLENEFFMSFYTIMTRKPSPFAIETLEDSILYVADYDEVNSQLEQDPFWIQVLKKMYAHNFILKAEREIQFLVYDTKTRYLNLLDSRPDLVARVPQYHLALYLGVNPVSLNRIIKSLD